MTAAIPELVAKISAAFPLAKIDVDPPLHEHGTYHIDVRLGDRLVVVEWSEQRAIGVSLVLDAALDGGPDFRLANAEGALRTIKLLLSEAQDASFEKDLGNWTAETPETVGYEDLLVTDGERRAPRRKAA